MKCRLRSLLSVLGVLSVLVLSGCNNATFDASDITSGQSLSETSKSITVASTDLGQMYPTSGTYSPVDVNGDTTGFGWDTATWDEGADVVSGNTTFGLYSANATKILLEIYTDASGEDATYDYWMEKGSDDVWRAQVEGIGDGTYYAFRCWGPNWTYNADWSRGNSAEGFISDCDSDGNRFNPNKVVFDPRARELSHDTNHPTIVGDYGGMFATGGDDFTTPDATTVTRRNFDTGKYVTKGIVVDDVDYTGTKPGIDPEDAIIYEAHVRGFTKHESVSSLSSILSGIDGFEDVSDIPESYRGTFKGAGMMAPYLKGLGINTIELLPVQETENDGNSDTEAGGNFWGYMTFGYFAPDRRYSYDQSAGGPTAEFKEMVEAFHDEGIEVYMDVVYNHSGEGGTWDDSTPEIANTTFMRGIDNSTYYCLCGDDNDSYWQTSGCGNNLQCDNAEVRDFIEDSLTYWLEIMGVDGFRFDLCPVLGREYNSGDWDWNSNATTLTEIATLAENHDAEVIAEPWDCSGDYEGQFPYGWTEWSGDYRDAIRPYINNSTNSSATYYFNGAYDSFNDQGGAEKVVNLICAHDGFTLADLVSYDLDDGSSLNDSLEWPFGPSDGGNSDSNDVVSSEKYWRRQAERNFMTFQMFSRGIPMIVYGDELCRTQDGNNNPYNLDSVATWNNYNMINTDTPQSIDTGYTGADYDNNFGTFNNDDDVNGNFMFFKYLANLRQNEPGLTESDYDVSIEYQKEDGSSTLSSGDLCIWVKINGSDVAEGSDYLLFSNMYSSSVDFTIPAPTDGMAWVRVIDTANWAEGSYNYWEDSDTSTAIYTEADSYGVNAYSIVVLKQVSTDTTVVEDTDTTTDDDTVTIYVEADSAPSIWVWQPSGIACSEEMGYTWWTQPTMASATNLNDNSNWYAYEIDSDYYTEGEDFSFILNYGSTITTSKSDTFWYDDNGYYYDYDPTSN